jgi:CubicO group peptidase (beta-lactamase class C family)
MRHTTTLVLTCWIPVAAALLPAADLAGHKLLVTSVRTGDTEIFIVDPATGDATNVTRSPGSEDLYPCWSPDGGRIAFISDRAGAPGLFVAGADGTGVRPVVRTAAACSMPSWAGDRIVFDLRGEKNEIASIRDDGTDLRNLGDGHDPCISPDGRWIAFAGRVDGGVTLFVMDAEGTNRRRLVETASRHGAVFPSWSPDGRRIAYSWNVGDALEVFVVDAVGSGARQVTRSGKFCAPPAWSPGGEWISFRLAGDAYRLDPGHVADVHSGKPAGDRPVWIVRPDGSDAQAIETLRFQCGIDTSRASWMPRPLQSLDAHVERVRKAFEVPGIAVAIVKDGKVVHAKGHGVRRIGEPAPVDAQTLFGIASNTKVFTAAALALLVEEGKLEWDAPVIRYLPWFHMWDPFVTRELTVRDLLVHRSGLGLGAGDLLWWPPSTYDRKEIARRLAHVQPASSFRSAYAYDNVLYLVAGEVIEAVSGRTWEDFVSSRILARVGMSGSSVRLESIEAGGNIATPHARIEGSVRAVKTFADDITNPAGGIVSNVEDMARWLLVLLDEGRLPDGARLFSERTSEELATLVTPMPVPRPEPELAALRANFAGYGLGLFLRDYRGKKIVTHTGGLPGYVSRVLLVPEIELGVAVLTNQESGAAFDSVAYHVVDAYLGGGATDWVAGFLAVEARRRAEVEAGLEKATATRDASSGPSLALPRYAGTYRDAWYGDIAIREEEGKLTLRFLHTPALTGDLEHWQHDTFVVRWRDRELRADAYITFALRPDGSIERAKMQAVSPETDFSFDFHDLLLEPVKNAR